MGEKNITGGSLAGLLSYRREALDTVQHDLGRMAAGLALAFNRVHEQGVDLNGDPGKQFFTLDQSKVILGSDNTGAAAVTDQFEIGRASWRERLCQNV